MKKIYKLILACWLLLPAMAFSQRVYSTSIKYTFSAGAAGNFVGNINTDFTITQDAVDGFMNVIVNLQASPWSVLNDYTSNCWGNPTLILNQKNRYVEFRVKSASPISGTWEEDILGCDGCCPTRKTWPTVPFNIQAANTWQIFFSTIGPTTGGGQNMIDTAGTGMDFRLKNGTYSFDYVYVGDAAVPPVPTIDLVKTQNKPAGVAQQITLTGINIPGRLTDGLVITAASKSDGFISDISFVDLTGNGTYIDFSSVPGQATLNYTPVAGMQGYGDSIIVTLTDTIRQQVKNMAFYVNILPGTNNSLSSVTDKISVYPTVTKGDQLISVVIPEAVKGGIITVIDIMGKTVSSQKIDGTSSKVDLSVFASGVYFLKIFDGTNEVTKKVVKE